MGLMFLNYEIRAKNHSKIGQKIARAQEY